MRAIPLLILALSVGLPAQQVIDSHTTKNLRGVSVPSKNVAWASGTHGTYLRSTDAGKTWQAAQVPGAETLDFRDVEAFDSEIAYLLAAGPGEQSRIYKTTDAGKNWALQFTNKDPKGFFDCMAFWDRDHGIAVGDPVDGKFELITTTDGGGSWTPAVKGDLDPPTAIEGEGAFAASGTCIATEGKSDVWFATGGTASRVFHSSDAGKNWKWVKTPIIHGEASSGIFSIAFRDAKHGVIAGGDYKQPGKDGPNMAATEDGGTTWNLVKVSPQSYFSAAAFSSENPGHLFVAGTAHAAYLDNLDAKSWKHLWDFNLNAVAVSPDGLVVGVGPKGAIVLFNSID